MRENGTLVYYLAFVHFVTFAGNYVNTKLQDFF